jgi:hypothetical protein
LLADALFIASSHNLSAPNHPHYRFNQPAVLLGARVALFPLDFFGVELEGGYGLGSVGRRTSAVPAGFQGPDDIHPARFGIVRAQLIAQLPSSRVVPFAVLGAGLITASSTQMRSDTDFLLDAGLGLKVFATEHLVPRLDVRLGASQREGGGFFDGIALHSEVMLGVSFDFSAG